jgi:hypothetical protein
LSLRATAAWAAAAGVAMLSDVALLYRLQQIEGWLGAILAALLGEMVQVVDATSLGWPGVWAGPGRARAQPGASMPGSSWRRPGSAASC